MLKPPPPPRRKENKGKIKNSETGAVLIKKIAIHIIFLLQLKICTKIRGIFMLNPPSPPLCERRTRGKLGKSTLFY